MVTLNPKYPSISASDLAKLILHIGKRHNSTPSTGQVDPKILNICKYIEEAYIRYATLRYIEEHNQEVDEDFIDDCREVYPLYTELLRNNTFGDTITNAYELYKQIEHKLYNEVMCKGKMRIVPYVRKVKDSNGKYYYVLAKPDLIDTKAKMIHEFKLIRREFMDYAIMQASVFSYVAGMPVTLHIVNIRSELDMNQQQKVAILDSILTIKDIPPIPISDLPTHNNVKMYIKKHPRN